VANLEAQSFDRSDEVSEHPDGSARAEIVELNGKKVGRATMQPGWRWSVHGRPAAGTDSCEVEHIGYVIQGRLAVQMDDGTQIEIGPGEAYHVPPGHDAWVVGDEAVVNVDFAGLAK
jgi:quercetin dioxygenase-like cupin family protein